jgi:predicted ATPase
MFVGREKETKLIIKELMRGHNIVIEGKFGIGRTSLVKHVSSLLVNKWRFIFVDFSQTPGKMSEKLMKELHIPKMNRQTGKRFGYKSMRYRIANMLLPKGKKTVIVFDNIAKITPQKTIFLRHLILEQHFQFIAIVEHFLPENDLFFLKAQLLPAATVFLHNLNSEDVVNYLRHLSDRHRWNWPEDHISSMASLIGGYPLGMIEMMKKKISG